MISPLPVYLNITNQPHAVEAVLTYQLGLGRQDLERAAEQIRRADAIVVGAIGASYSASIPFCYRLAGHGVKIILEDAAELLHYSHEAYGANTVYLLVSRSGQTIEIVKLLERLKGRDCCIIGVTNEPESQLASEADICLLVGSPVDDLVAIQTYSGTLLTLNLLAELLAGRLDTPEYRHELAPLAGLVAQVLRQYQELSTAWSSSFRSGKSLYLLARGASLASANEGALLFHEMARFPAVAFGAGHFRHGPWEVVDDEFCAFVFAPDDNTYALNVGLAQDLAGMGGEVKLITPLPPSQMDTRVSVWSVPGTDRYLEPLLEILPVQLFVHEFALWRGLVPGVFRASLPITLSELGSKVSR